MPDDTYRFVLAEEIALWVADPDKNKPTLLTIVGGLTPLGQKTVDKILCAIHKQHPVIDERGEPPTFREGQIIAIRLYADTDFGILLPIAEEAVR